MVALIFPSILTSPYSPCALCWPAQVLHLGPSALRRSPCKPEWTLPSGLHDLVPHLWVIKGQTHVSDTGYVAEVVTDLFLWLVTCCIQVKPKKKNYRMNRSNEIKSEPHCLFFTLELYKKLFVVFCDCGNPDMDGQPAHHRQTAVCSPPAVNLLMACWDRAG